MGFCDAYDRQLFGFVIRQKSWTTHGMRFGLDSFTKWPVSQILFGFVVVFGLNG